MVSKAGTNTGSSKWFLAGRVSIELVNIWTAGRCKDKPNPLKWFCISSEASTKLHTLGHLYGNC